MVGDCQTHLGRQSRGEVYATRTQWAGVEVEKSVGSVFLCRLLRKESCVRHVWLVRWYDLNSTTNVNKCHKARRFCVVIIMSARLPIKKVPEKGPCACAGHE